MLAEPLVLTDIISTVLKTERNKTRPKSCQRIHTHNKEVRRRSIKSRIVSFLDSSPGWRQETPERTTPHSQALPSTYSVNDLREDFKFEQRLRALLCDYIVYLAQKIKKRGQRLKLNNVTLTISTGGSSSVPNLFDDGRNVSFKAWRALSTCPEKVFILIAADIRPKRSS